MPSDHSTKHQLGDRLYNVQGSGGGQVFPTISRDHSVLFLRGGGGEMKVQVLLLSMAMVLSAPHCSVCEQKVCK